MAKKVDIRNFLTGVDLLTTEMTELNKQIGLLKGNLIESQKAFNSSSKSQKDLADKTQKVQASTQKLSDIEKERIRLINQINKANATAIDKNEKLKIQLAQQRKVNKDFAREKLGLIGAYEKESKRLTELRKKYKDAIISGKENTASTKKLAAEVQKLDAKLKNADARAGQFQRNVGNYPKKIGLARNAINSFKKSIISLGASFLGIQAALMAFIGGIKNAVNTARSFEKANAELAGVLGVTREQTKALREDAQRLGATTAKSASEVVQLQQAYARLGFTQREIIDLTGDTINGSIALNADLASTAELTGALVNSFDNLGTTDAAKILDTLTLSTQKTALNFEFLNTALPIAAGAANGAGVAFEDLIDQLGQAADRGIDASTAATSLRNIYLELANKGLTLDEALSKINSSQDKLTAANDLFGKRAAVTALALAANASEATNFEQALSEVGGTAERVANEQLNTLEGDITLLKSAWEGFNLAITKTGGLRKIVQGITNAIGKLTEFVVQLKTDGGVLAAAFKTFFEAIKLNFFILGQLWDTFLLKPIKAVAESIEALANKDLEGVKNAIKGIFTNAKDNITETKDRFVEIGTTIADAYKGGDEPVEEILQQQTSAVKTELENQTDSYENELEKRLELQRKYEEEKQKLLSELPDVKYTPKPEFDEFEEFGFGLADEDLGEIFENIDKANEVKENQFFDEKARIEELAELKKIKREEDLENLAVFNEQLRGINQEAANFEIGLVEQKLKDRKISEERAEKQIAEIKRKAAIRDKALAIFDIGINTARAIVATLPNIPLSIAIGILGAVQAAAVAAKPIPKFRHGGKMKTDGLAQFSEEGSELAVLPNGQAVLTPDKQTVGFVPKGTEFFRHNSPETQIALNGGVSAEKYDELIKEQKLTRKAIQNQKQFTWTKQGLNIRDKANNINRTYINEFLRGENI